MLLSMMEEIWEEIAKHGLTEVARSLLDDKSFMRLDSPLLATRLEKGRERQDVRISQLGV